LWVDEHHLAGRDDAAKDLAGLHVAHTVQGGRLGVGLLKVNLGVFADVKAVPVNHSALAALVDIECVARLADVGLPRTDLPASGELGVRNLAIARRRRAALSPSRVDATRCSDANQNTHHNRTVRQYRRASSQSPGGACFRWARLYKSQHGDDESV